MDSFLLIYMCTSRPILVLNNTTSEMSMVIESSVKSDHGGGVTYASSLEYVYN